MDLVHNARAVFVNGFIFDELRLDVVQEACQKAITQGGAIFFDPGLCVCPVGVGVGGCVAGECLCLFALVYFICVSAVRQTHSP